MKLSCLSPLCITAALLLTACNPISAADTPVPLASATPGQSTSSLPETDVIDPFDPALPEWIIAADSGYRLKAGWEPAQIDYVYKWWGLRKAAFDWQEIKLRNGGYWNGAQKVPRESIRALLDSVVHLYPTQRLLTAATHTDDYPSLTVEIAGANGQRLLLTSTSNDYGRAPWNIFYNGRLYAQYDGTLTEPIAKLFTSANGGPMASYSSGVDTAGLMTFTTADLPPQLVYGFTGLLPIADGFSYDADTTTGEIAGFIQGRASIADLGHMVIGRIDKLSGLRLTLPDETLLDCSIESLPTQDPVGAAWEFHCPISEHPQGSYRYPIWVEFGTDAGETLVTEGELRGTWHTTGATLSLPLPPEIQQVLSRSDSAREVLGNQAIAFASYAAEISAKQGPLGGTFSGEISLSGKTEAHEKMWPYTLNTQFEISNGQLDRWDLSQAVVDELLSDINRQPITHRVQAAEPGVYLIIWYAELADTPHHVSSLFSAYYASNFSITLAKCEGLPGEGEYPRAGVPLRAFGFNYWRPQFVLIGGEAVASDLDFLPTQPGSGVPLVLLPQEFNTGEAPPFSRIWLNRDTIPDNSPPQLTLRLDEDTSEDTPIDPKDLEVYTRIADALPQAVEKPYNTLWEAENLAVEISRDGQLKVVACKASK